MTKRQRKGLTTIILWLGGLVVALVVASVMRSSGPSLNFLEKSNNALLPLSEEKISQSLLKGTPKILKLSEVKFGVKAVGFSVFKGVEPEKFNVQLGETIDAGGFNMILARISGGPMDTPLERIGAISGMSGSPIFIDCVEYDECLRSGTLVGALSYALGYFIESGPNVGLTPAEYMLGSQLGGYSIVRQFSTRPPDKIVIDGREFKNLMIFSGIDGVSLQGGMPDDRCAPSVKSEIKPGSMVTVFLARGSRNIGGSGTVTWRDGDKIYIFGHPLFGTGQVNYPFAQVSVADTLQTPLQAHKIVGCRLETEGAMLMDGAYEMGGVIGRVARTLPYKVELHLGNNLIVFNEEVSESPLASIVINQLPVLWAQQMLGDTNKISVAYQTRIKVTNEPELFLSGLIPVQEKGHPFVEALTRTSTTLGKLRESGFAYNLESIITHIDFIQGASVWTEKRSFLLQKTAKPGETVYINIILEERLSGAVRQVSIPVRVPDDFESRVTGVLPQILVTVQSADKFVDKSAPKELASLRDVIGAINESSARRQNVLYVQQIMPLTKAEREAAEEAAKSTVQPDWNWTELDQSALRRLPGESNQEVVLTITLELGHFIDFDRTFTISVNVFEKDEQNSEEKG